MATRPGVTRLRSRESLEKMSEALRLLADVEVLVGFPDDGTYRKAETGETDAYGRAIQSVEASDITNAALGYIHDNGSPEANIPARPFMLPGINEVEKRIVSKMAQVTNAVVKKGADALVVEQGMHQVGLIAKLAIQNKINEGVPPPLADSTLRARARKGRKGAGLELLSRSHGIEPSMDFAKPLVDTGQLRNAVNYVIRSRKKRRR
jgi:hypothetical protein